jgi:hypothetical protein
MKQKVAAGTAALALWAVVGSWSSSDQPPRHQSIQPEPFSISATPRTRSVITRIRQSASPSESISGFLVALEIESDPDRRSELLDLAVESLSNTDVPIILDSLARAEQPASIDFCKLLAGRWAGNDALAASGWAAQLPESAMRNAVVEQVALARSATDLAAAIEWVTALPESDSKQAATLSLAYESARADPVVALGLASALAATAERNDLLVHTISQWAATDLDRALDWASQVSDAALRQRLMEAVSVASAEGNGAQAATLAATRLHPGAEQDRAAVAIVQRWAQHSPQEAGEWVAEFPDIPSRNAALHALLTIWASRSADAAGAWLSQLPDGTFRSVGITFYSQVTAQ